MRFTALDHAVMRKLAQMMNRIRPTAPPSAPKSMTVSRRNDTAVEAGVMPVLVGKLQREHAEGDADDRLAEDLVARP